MSQINSLSPEQIEKLAEYRDRWINIGLSTAPTDYVLAEQYIADAYKVAGLKPPKIIIRLGSPLAGAYAAALLTLLPEGLKEAPVRDQVWARVWDQVVDQVWDPVRSQVRSQVGAQVRSQVWDLVRSQVGGQVWDQVLEQVRSQVWPQVGSQVWDLVRSQVWEQVRVQAGSQVKDQVWAQVWDRVGDQVWDQVRRCGYGSQDAEWLSYYNYFLEVTGLECCKELHPLMKLAEVAGWWWPFGNAIIITDRPKEIHRDARFRLHRDGGPALVYPDGWGLYRWHGVEIDKYYIETPADQIDLKRVMSESNATVRMAVIQKCGFLHLKHQLKNKLISKTDSADLLEFDLGSVKVRGLHVQWKDKFGAPLETIIPVPREKTQFGEDCPNNPDDAEQVRRWTLYMKPQDSFALET